MKTNIMLYLSLVLLLIISCKDKTTSESLPQPQPKVITGELRFHLHSYLGVDVNNEVQQYSDTASPDPFVTSDGLKISLSMAQVYLSDIQLVKINGSLVDVKDSIVLKVLEEEALVIGQVPVGNYKSIKFRLGLNPTQNKLPSAAKAVLNHPEMWFGSTAQPDGYIFLNLQGKIGLTSTPNSELKFFEYKLGTNANAPIVSMLEQPFSVVQGSTVYVHMYADYSKVFSGIDITNAANLKVATPADNASDLAKKLVENTKHIFVYEN